MIRDSNKMKYNPFFLLRWRRHEEQEDGRKHWKTSRNTKKMKITEGYDLVSEPSSDTNWCEPHDHVVTPPTIKIEIWSWKAEIGLIGVWHNGNLPQGTNSIGLSRMTPRSQLIFFDKSDSVCSRTEERKNHSHMLKLKNSEVIIIKSCWNFGLHEFK